MGEKILHNALLGGLSVPAELSLKGRDSYLQEFQGLCQPVKFNNQEFQGLCQLVEIICNENILKGN